MAFKLPLLNVDKAVTPKEAGIGVLKGLFGVGKGVEEKVIKPLGKVVSELTFLGQFTPFEKAFKPETTLLQRIDSVRKAARGDVVDQEMLNEGILDILFYPRWAL